VYEIASVLLQKCRKVKHYAAVVVTRNYCYSCTI